MVFLPQFGRLLKTDKDSSDISDVVTEGDGICMCTCHFSIQGTGRGRRNYKDWEVEAILSYIARFCLKMPRLGLKRWLGG